MNLATECKVLPKKSEYITIIIWNIYNKQNRTITNKAYSNNEYLFYDSPFIKVNFRSVVI